jgi:hypothetical protein
MHAKYVNIWEERSVGYFKRKKVKFSMCLTKHHAMKVYLGSEGIVPRIVDLGTRWR